MAANSNIQLASLDFSDIKNNFTNFLKNQDTFKDYNFAGSGLSHLLDVLAYNTQYNAFYLNMVANEMFLDTAVQRSSVVSLAKMLNYTPKSNIAPTATVNVAVYSVANSTLTLPAYTRFLSKSINGTNYSFVTTDSKTVQVSANTAMFTGIPIKQGIQRNYNFTYSSTANPSSKFSIPDPAIDTSTLIVQVQQSSSNTSFTVYKNATDVGYSNISGNTAVYFLQEGLTGNYEIYFGDGIFGKQLDEGNVIKTSFLTTQGTASAGANAFTLMTSVGGYANTRVFPVTPATQGSNKESIESIKFQAPKAYASRGRAVTKADYITILQQNTLGYTFDAVNVWGGEENDPPEYGNIFISIKPTGGYTLTDSQKLDIINNIIKPSSVMTVTPKIVSPDYVYFLISSNVLYDPKLTNLSTGQIETIIRNGIKTFCNQNLNKFNSVFVVGNLINYIQNLNQSIIVADIDLFLQKRFIPALNSSQSYTLNFGDTLQNGIGDKSLQFSPSFSTYSGSGVLLPEVYYEQSPDSTTNIDMISVTEGGANYTNPTVTIYGDGTGATAKATVVGGSITAIEILTGGSNYTQATVVISDSTGVGATANAVLKGNYAFLRTYYYNNGVKNILTGSGISHSSNAGNIDYDAGILTLKNFYPVKLNNGDGIMRVTAYPANRIIYSSFDRIMTLDNFDPAAITVNLTAISR